MCAGLKSAHSNRMTARIFYQPLIASAPSSLYRRFFTVKRYFTEREHAFFLNVDFDKHVALVALMEEAGRKVIVGGGRYVVVQLAKAEVAFAVIDQYQGQGIGSLLMRHLAAIARAAGLRELIAEILSRKHANAEGVRNERTPHDCNSRIRRHACRPSPQLSTWSEIPNRADISGAQCYARFVRNGATRDCISVTLPPVGTPKRRTRSSCCARRRGDRIAVSICFEDLLHLLTRSFGTFLLSRDVCCLVTYGGQADIRRTCPFDSDVRPGMCRAGERTSESGH